MELVLSTSAKRHLRSIKASPGGSYLFYGPEAVGKFAAANKLAAALGSHLADIVVVETDKASVGIELIHELRQNLQLKGAKSQGQRLAIIRDAHKMTREAQNALLKVLEEPPTGTTMMLVADHLDSLLPTVISRCKQVEFSLPAPERVLSMAGTLVAKPAAKRLVQLAAGRPGLVVRLAEDEEARGQLLELHQTAKNIMDGELYEQLRAAKQATDNKQSEAVLLKVAGGLRQRLHRDPASATLVRQLQLIEELIRYLSANGSAKFALDKAILELSQ